MGDFEDAAEVGQALDAHHAPETDSFRADCLTCGQLTNRTGTGPLKHMPETAHLVSARRWLASNS